MKAENIIGGPNSAANPPIEGAPPSEPRQGTIGETLGYLSKADSFLYALEAVFEQLADHACGADAFPIFTAAEACAESAHNALREGIQTALRADMENAGRPPTERGHESDPALAVKSDVKPSVIRLMALVDMASSVAEEEDDIPPPGHGTDKSDKLTALMNAMRLELESLHAEVPHD